MAVEPYLFLNGCCEEAMDFYAEALGATVVMSMRFSDSPEPEHVPPGAEAKIMHATLEIQGTHVMMSDGMGDGKPTFAGFALSLQADSVDAGRALFDALAQDGTVQMPFEKTFWAPGFGMVNDRFGVPWMVNVDAPVA